MQEALPEMEPRCENPDCSNPPRPGRLNGRVPRYCSKVCQRAAARLRRKQASVELAHKPCCGCQVDKPIDAFTKPWSPYCRTCLKVRNKERYERIGGRDAAYATALRYRYGMTVEEYNAKLTAQDGRCAVCKEEPKGRLHVDHNHETGVTRDLLCDQCNHAIGKAREDPARLRAMAAYLERHRERDPRGISDDQSA